MKENQNNDNFILETKTHPKPIQYLITGISGFIGREIAVQLRKQGYLVRGLIRNRKQNIPMPDGVELFEGDVLQLDTLKDFFTGIKPKSTVLIHAAAYISVRKNNLICERVNFEGTKNIISACKKYGINRLIYFSSVDTLPPCFDGSTIFEPLKFFPQKLPTSYGRSKASATQHVLDSTDENLDCTVLLPSAVIGPGDFRNGFITQILNLYLSGIFRLGVNGGYEFVDVRDVAAATITVSKKNEHSDCYILSNRYANVKSIFDTISAYTGRKSTRLILPIKILYPVALIISAIYIIARKEPPLTLSAVNLMRVHSKYCYDKAKKELDFFPRPFEQTLKDTIMFLQKQKNK